MLRQHAPLLKYLTVGADLFIIELNWFVWYKITTTPTLGFVHEAAAGKFNSWKTGTVLALVWIVLTGASRLYESRRIHTIVAEWWDIAKFLFAVTVVFIFLVSHFLDVHILSRGGFAGFYITAVTTLCLQRTALRFSLRAIRKRGFNYRRVLIVGAGKLGIRVSEKIEADPWLGYRIVGYLDDVVVDSVRGKYSVLGTVQEFREIVRKHRIDKVMVALPLRAHQKMEMILEAVSDTLLDCSVIPDFYQFHMLRSGIRDLDGLPILDIVATPIEGTDALIKRVIDVTLSVMILLITSPLFLVIALGVKLSSPGPVFFAQERGGMGKKRFRLYKFRSMRLHDELQGEVDQAVRDDPRVTPFGKFLRRTSLDELPQFFNVVKGTMSIVGPRPHAVSHDQYYQTRIPPYLQRHRIKPGITGWAQINGWRGETADITDMGKRIEFDLEYIQNWDIWFDIKIILMTLYRGFVGKGAY